jgi:signal transduction histidine kinase
LDRDAFLEDVGKLIDNLELGSRRITSIVSDLRSYVRSDDEERRAAAIRPVVERAMTLVGKQVRKLVRRLDVEVADGLPEVVMSPNRIEQVLINLLINAGHAADKEDSFVRLTARPARAQPGWVELVVEDNGAGIAPDQLERIFEPFYTTKGRDQGTGLGLSISQRIVEEHGGKLVVESTPGAGSCFTVHLPPAP